MLYTEGFEVKRNLFLHTAQRWYKQAIKKIISKALNQLLKQLGRSVGCCTVCRRFRG